MPSVTLCIINHESTEFLLDCLKSLYDAPPAAAFEVHVIENVHATDAERVRAQFPDITVTLNEQPLGFSQNCNKVIKASASDYVFLLNPDTRVTGSAIDVLLEFLEKNPMAACCGPRILNFDGTLQFSARSFPNIFMAFFRGMPAGFLFPKNRHVREYLMLDWDHQSLREVDWVSGAAMMLRRSALNDVGVFDEDYFIYVEDVDWCYRAKKKGHQVFYVPDAVVYHYRHASTQTQAVRMIVEHHKSMYTFYVKHHKAGGKLRVPILLGLVARCSIAIAGNRMSKLKERFLSR